MNATTFAREMTMVGEQLEELRRLAETPANSVEAGAIARGLHTAQLALQALAVTQQALRRQNEELLLTRTELQAQQRRYQDLFELAPDGYLVTDRGGKILEANESASLLLHVSRKALVGKPLGNYIDRECAAAFHENLSRLETVNRLDWQATLQPRRAEKLVAELTAAAVHGAAGEVVAVRWLVRDATAKAKAREAIAVYQQRLRSMASELAFSEERERRRIAQSLHDDITQTLAISKIKLGALRQAARAAGLEKQVEEVGDLVAEAIARTRSLTFELSPPVLYELGLEAALEWLAEQTSKQRGIRVDFGNDRRPKPADLEIAVVLFQAVRELLNNVVLHATARRAAIVVARPADSLVIVVSDDGRGFDPGALSPPKDAQREFGLFTIRTRLEYLGGRIEIESRPGTGTRVTLVAPLRVEFKGAAMSGPGVEKELGNENPTRRRPPHRARRAEKHAGQPIRHGGRR